MDREGQDSPRIALILTANKPNEPNKDHPQIQGITVLHRNSIIP